MKTYSGRFIMNEILFKLWYIISAYIRINRNGSDFFLVLFFLVSLFVLWNRQVHLVCAFF